MEHRRLGTSGLKVPVLSFGAGTFGGGSDFFRAWGDTDVDEARRLVDICLDAGVTLFDTADVYSSGALRGDPRRGARGPPRPRADLDQGDAADGRRPERRRLVAPPPHPRLSSRACGACGTDHIDLSSCTTSTRTTAVEETLRTLDDLVRAGKVRYVGGSNFSGWQLMKSLAIADRHGWTRYVAHQVYYSLDRPRLRVGADAARRSTRASAPMVWSPLGWGRLTGKLRRGQAPPPDSRLGQPAAGRLAGRTTSTSTRASTCSTRSRRRPARACRRSRSTGCCSGRPSPTLVIGARNEEQLRDNLGAVGWALDAEQVARLDQVSRLPVPYPYDHQQEKPFFLPAPWTTA